MSKSRFISRTRGGGRGRLFNRRDVRDAEEYYRRSGEVKYSILYTNYTTFTAFDYATYVPSITVLPRGGTWDYSHKLYFPFNRNAGRGGAIGRIIKPKRLTVDINFSYNMILNNDLTNSPLDLANTLSKNFLFDNQIVYVQCILFRYRSDPLTFQYTTTNDQLTFDERYYRIPQTGVALGSSDKKLNLPFSPTVMDVIQKDCFQLRLSCLNDARYSDNIPIVHHTHFSVPIIGQEWKLSPSGTILLNSDPTQQYGIYTCFNSSIHSSGDTMYDCSDVSGYPAPVLDSYRYIKLSYYDH